MDAPIIVGIDVGTTKICTLVARLEEDDQLPGVEPGVVAGARESEDGVVGPAGLDDHPAFGHLVHSRIFLDALLDSLARERHDRSDTTEVRVHPSAISMLRGLKNANVRLVEDRYGRGVMRIVADRAVGRRELVVDGRLCRPYG